jgi:hypothetical protein
MGEKIMSTKIKGHSFLRIFLSSGTRYSPLGDEELAIFYKCNSDEPSIEDVDVKGLVQWVNSNHGCKKNQSNESYRVSQQIDSVSVIYLNDREIESCRLANRIYPCES